MMKRVKMTQIAIAVTFLALSLAFCAQVTPAFAREEMSVGQAGDPTDGEDCDSGGGTLIPPPSASGARGTSSELRPVVLLVPFVVGGATVFRIVTVTLSSPVGTVE